VAPGASRSPTTCDAVSLVTPTDWRLIWSGHLSAADNMGVDEAIFESVAAGETPPTLRIYGWTPPGVSLGYFQALEPGVNLNAVRHHGYGLVRLPTGGRAIIHHHEVTYSVCIRLADLTGGHSVLQSYRAISRGIEAGLTLLGVSASIPGRRATTHEKGRELPTVCFAKAGGGDMLVDGRKIVGSAQMRRDGAVLQHGSIPIRIDLEEHLEILGGEGTDVEAEQRALRQAACGVADAIGREVSFEELAHSIAAGFAQVLACNPVQADLTPHEQARATELVAAKYGNELWNATPGRRL
jgi:lipoate-protein ligase A